MKKKKKIILIVVLVLVVGGIIAGIIAYRYNHSKAYVAPVADINNTWILQNNSSEGTISDAATQKITLEDTDVIAEVYVAEGDTVAAGDPLFQYDTQALELDVEAKQIEVESITNQLNTAKKQLDAYNKITPVASHDTTVYELMDAQKLADPYKGSGTTADPYCYLCTKDTIVTGSKINELIDGTAVATFEIREGNAPTGTLINSWTIDGSNFLSVEEDSYWSVVDKTQWYPEVSTEVTYTQSEKDRMISDKQLEINKLENSIKLAENAAQQSKQKLEDATVKATVPGIIKTIGDPKNLPKDGSAFLEITGQEGISLTGHIDEMDLENTKVGDQITVMSYESGTTTTATITEIADYPDESYQGYSEGNNNVSYYEYQAYMEDSSGFSIGESVSTQAYVSDMEDTIVLEKIYVRSDKGKHYVYKKNKKGRLSRQEVSIKSTSDSQYVIITEGLTLEDSIAFPYGDKAKNGIKTTDKAPLVLF